MEKSAKIVSGNINTADINATHTKMRELMKSYNDLNLDVAKITQRVRENWVGDGKDEFETQYRLLIRKVDDFGDALKDIYDALVEAESKYEEQDLKIKNQISMSKKE